MKRNAGLLLLLCQFCVVSCGRSATSARNAEPPENQAVPFTRENGTLPEATATSSSSSVAASNSASPPAGASGAEHTAPPSSTSPPAGASIAEQDAAKQPPNARPLTDAEIAGVTEAANASEIEAAKVAERKAKDAEVRRFAGMMLTHHQQAQRELAKLRIRMADSPVSVQLDTEAASNMDLLKNTSRDFDRVYIDSQVELHRTVLTLIDDRLLPAVQDPNLRAYLQNMRGQIQTHLEKAQLEQQTLSAPSASTTSSTSRKSFASRATP